MWAGSCYGRYCSLPSYIDRLLTVSVDEGAGNTGALCCNARQNRHRSLGVMLKREACEVLCGMCGMEGKGTVHMLWWVQWVFVVGVVCTC